MYYHIKLLTDNSSGETRINLTEDELKNRYVEPYLKGETILINGTTLDPYKLQRVKITSSDTTLDKVINQIKNEDELDPSPYKIFRDSVQWRAIDTATDVTDKFINKAPGSSKNKIIPTETKPLSIDDSNKVFVVHGHDTELKNDVEIFLRSINLEPIVLHRQIDEGLTVIEKFEKHSKVKYAIILLTPDDIGFPIIEANKKEKERKIEYRARQNVIFEFGFFIGKLNRKNVCCIYKEGVTVPSDLNGFIYKEVKKTVEEHGMFLMRQLKSAGLTVKFD
jgi:predicted nucleotide-binding protein